MASVSFSIYKIGAGQIRQKIDEIAPGLHHAIHYLFVQGGNFSEILIDLHLPVINPDYFHSA